MNKLIDNLPHLKNKNKIRKIDNFSNNNKGLDNTELLGVNIIPSSKLSGSEVNFNQNLNLSATKTNDENNIIDNNIMSFLTKNNLLDKPIRTIESDEEQDEEQDEVQEEEQEHDEDQAAENFSNFHTDFKLDYIGNFYVTSLSVIMIYYIYKGLRR